MNGLEASIEGQLPDDDVIGDIVAQDLAGGGDRADAQGVDPAQLKRVHAQLAGQVTGTFTRRMPSGGTIHIEEVQDQVELALMRSGNIQLTPIISHRYGLDDIYDAFSFAQRREGLKVMVVNEDFSA